MLEQYEAPATVNWKEKEPYKAPAVDYVLPTYKPYIPTYESKVVEKPYDVFVRPDYGQLFEPYDFFEKASDYGAENGFNYGKFYNEKDDPLHTVPGTTATVGGSTDAGADDADVEQEVVLVTPTVSDDLPEIPETCLKACADVRAERDSLAAELYLMKVKYEGYSGPYYFPAYHQSVEAFHEEPAAEETAPAQPEEVIGETQYTSLFD